MTKHDINKAYVSPIDKFLYEFDAKHEKSLSQLKEIKKYQRIFAMRDNPDLVIEDVDIWTEF